MNPGCLRRKRPAPPRSRAGSRLFLRYDPGPARTPADFRQAAVGVVLLARFFYLFTAYLTGRELDFTRAWSGEPLTAPLWPITVVQALVGVGWMENGALLSAAAALVCLLAVVFPGALAWRLGVFLYLFLFVALQNSYGSINHGHYFLIYVSFTLLFLPSTISRPQLMSRQDAMCCLLVLWLTQGIMLLSYSLAGFWKVLYSRWQLLAPDGMVRILLGRVMDDTRPVPELLAWLAPYSIPAQLLLLGAVYIQLFAILALFRPHLHRPWGIALILFHFGTDWFLDVSFRFNILCVGLFLVFSPMAPSRSITWIGTARSLPLLGLPFRLWANSRRP